MAGKGGVESSTMGPLRRPISGGDDGRKRRRLRRRCRRPILPHFIRPSSLALLRLLRLLLLMSSVVVVVVVGAMDGDDDGVAVRRATTAAKTKSSASASAARQEPQPYTKYPSYHPHCSTPSDMDRRSIPSLQHHNSNKGAKLVHVTVFIRHGTRTITSNKHCWPGFWDNPQWATWNCDHSTTTASSTSVAPAAAVDEDGETATTEGEAVLLFEKKYDALLRHYSTLSTSRKKAANVLNGTCQSEQLLQLGRDQEEVNGKHLRHAYVHDGIHQNNLAAVDERMRLFDWTTADFGDDDDEGGKMPWEEPHTRYRADDFQRTVESGQILLSSMWSDDIARLMSPTTTTEEEDGEAAAAAGRRRRRLATAKTVLHTADLKNDILTGNSYHSSTQSSLRSKAEKSDEYHAIAYSDEADALQTEMKQHLGGAIRSNEIIDCLMSIMCTDRPLPDALDDYDSFDETEAASGGGGGDQNATRSFFRRLVDFAARKQLYQYIHNDGAFSQVFSGPLWSEIMDNIRSHIVVEEEGKGGRSERARDSTKKGAPQQQQGCSKRPPPPRMALFSGHETTLHALLGSLGGKVLNGTMWAPFASMMIIEIYEIQSSESSTGHAFRLLYNGEALTSRMDGCPDDSDLCDATVLLDRVAQFATPLAELVRDDGDDDECDDTLAASPDETAPNPELPPALDGDVPPTAPLCDCDSSEFTESKEAFAATPRDVVLHVSIVVICSALSSLATFVCLTRRLPGKRRRGSRGARYDRTVMYQDESSMDDDCAPRDDSKLANGSLGGKGNEGSDAASCGSAASEGSNEII